MQPNVMRTAHFFRLLAAILLGFSASLSIAETAPSPLHISLAELSHDREQGRLLLNLRVQSADLEAVLTAKAGKTITTAEPVELTPLALEYVRDKLHLKSPKGDPLRLEWAGFDLAGPQLFLFFEASLPGGLEGLQISNQLLLENNPGQINVVEIRSGATRQTLVFSREKTELIANTKP